MQAVNRVIDGPSEGNIDGWVTQVLVDIGNFLKAAAPALDYEVGRVISGVDRPLGEFPNNLSWRGAGIATDARQANTWIAVGELARGDRPPAATQQRALAALLRPIASVSCHSWFQELETALDALRFGETHRIVVASPSRLRGYKEARPTWLVRLHALAWAEFQAGARLMTKTEALGEVASACGISDLSSVVAWKERCGELFGAAVLQETLSWSLAASKRYRSLRNQVDTGTLKRSEAARELEYFERAFGRQRLQRIAQTYRNQARKRSSKPRQGRAVG